MLRQGSVGHRIVDHDFGDEIAKRADEIGHLGVARIGHVLLEGKTHHQHAGAIDALLALEHGPDDVVGNVGGHAIVDAAAGEDHLRMETDRFRFMGHIVGIDADTVTADETGTVGLEIPLGARRFEDLPRIEPEFLEQHGELIDQRNIDVALDVLDHFGGFGHPDRAHAMRPGRNDGGIDLIDEVGCLERRTRSDLDDVGKAVSLVARIDALRRIADEEVAIESEARFLF